MSHFSVCYSRGEIHLWLGDMYVFKYRPYMGAKHLSSRFRRGQHAMPLGISSGTQLLSQRSVGLPAGPALPSYLPHAEAFSSPEHLK